MMSKVQKQIVLAALILVLGFLAFRFTREWGAGWSIGIWVLTCVATAIPFVYKKQGEKIGIGVKLFLTLVLALPLLLAYMLLR
jgi:beta-lactamase regulating signal transducer with metallopeptidase domain